MNHNSSAWNTFTVASFVTALSMVVLGIWQMPSDLWVKGYMIMGTVFLIGSTVSLTKALRDKYETERMSNRIEEAKTDKILREFDTVTS